MASWSRLCFSGMLDRTPLDAGSFHPAAQAPCLLTHHKPRSSPVLPPANPYRKSGPPRALPERIGLRPGMGVNNLPRSCQHGDPQVRLPESGIHPPA